MIFSPLFQPDLVFPSNKPELDLNGNPTRNQVSSNKIKSNLPGCRVKWTPVARRQCARTDVRAAQAGIRDPTAGEAARLARFTGKVIAGARPGSHIKEVTKMIRRKDTNKVIRKGHHVREGGGKGEEGVQASTGRLPW